MFDNLLDRELGYVGYSISAVAVIASFFLPGLYLLPLGLIMALTTFIATTKGFE